MKNDYMHYNFRLINKNDKQTKQLKENNKMLLN